MTRASKGICPWGPREHFSLGLRKFWSCHVTNSQGVDLPSAQSHKFRGQAVQLSGAPLPVPHQMRSKGSRSFPQCMQAHENLHRYRHQLLWYEHLRPVDRKHEREMDKFVWMESHTCGLDRLVYTQVLKCYAEVPFTAGNENVVNETFYLSSWWPKESQ